MTNPAQPVVGVGAVVFKDNAVLLVKRKNPPFQDQWAIPGGKVKTGETLQQAAEREILEETGIKIKAKDSVYIFDLIERDSEDHILYHYVIIDLDATYVSGELQANDDAIDAKWITSEESRTMTLTQTTKALLEEKYNFYF